MYERVTQQSSDRWVEGVVPLGSYAWVLFVWWREIILGAISVAVGAGAFLLALQVLLPRYESQVDVAIIPTRTSVSIDDRMSTVAPRQHRERLHRSQARQAALVGLVHNGNVARAVSEQMIGQMEDDEAKDAYLLTQIRVDLVTNDEFSAVGTKNSDLIRITARANSPEKAANLADAWGEEYTAHVNLLYQEAPASVMRGVATETQRAKEAYNVAQGNLEAFVNNSKIAQLERHIADKEFSVGVLRDLQKKSIEARTSNYTSRQQAIAAIEELQIGTLKKSLEATYDVRQKLLLLQQSAQALRIKIEDSNGVGLASTWLPLLLLNADIYASTARLPDVLDLSVNNSGELNIDRQEQLSDLDGILKTAAVQIESLDVLIHKQIRDLESFSIESRKLGESTAPTLPSADMEINSTQLESLEKEIQVLQAAHIKASAKLDDLTQDRDLRRAALESLQNESIELLLMSASATRQVRLASKAVIPLVSAYPSPKLIIPLGGAVGLFIIVCLAFLMNSIGFRPPFGRNGTV